MDLAEARSIIGNPNRLPTGLGEAAAYVLAELDECDAQNAQLGNAGRAVLDNAIEANSFGRGVYQVDDDVLDEFRAVLDGNATPTDQ